MPAPAEGSGGSSSSSQPAADAATVLLQNIGRALVNMSNQLFPANDVCSAVAQKTAPKAPQKDPFADFLEAQTDVLQYGFIQPEPLPIHREKEVHMSPEACFGLITRQLFKNDKEYHSAEADAATRKELTMLRDKPIFKPGVTLEYEDAVKMYPDALLTKLMHILGIKHHELGPAFWKYKARCVLRGDNMKHSDGQPAQFADVSSCPTSVETMRSIVIYSIISGHVPTCSDALMAYIQPLFGPDEPVTIVVFDQRYIY